MDIADFAASATTLRRKLPTSSRHLSRIDASFVSLEHQDGHNAAAVRIRTATIALIGTHSHSHAIDNYRKGSLAEHYRSNLINKWGGQEAEDRPRGTS